MRKKILFLFLIVIAVISLMQVFKSLSKYESVESYLEKSGFYEEYDLITDLEIDGKVIKSIKGLHKANGLKSLTIKNFDSVDIEEVCNLKKLEKLTIENSIIYNIRKITNIKELKALSLSNNNLNKIDFDLSKFKNIEYCNLSKNKIESITDIRSSSLVELNISQNKLKTLNGISGCKTLRSLDIQQNPLTDIKEVLELENLEVLLSEKNKFDQYTYKILKEKIPSFMAN